MDIIYHRWHAKHVAEVRAAGVILRDVREVSEIVGVLAGAVDVADFVFTDRLLSCSGITISDKDVSLILYAFSFYASLSARRRRALR